MRFPELRTGVAITALLGLSSMGTFCILPDGGGNGPPDPSTACASGEPPAAGADVLFFSAPEGGGSPLAADTVLHLEYGPQGGQHVMVGIRHHTSGGGVWAYRIAFEPETPAPESPEPGALPRPPVLEGSNTVPVNACASGWTETIAPLFVQILDGGQSDASGQIPEARGVLRVVATEEGSAEQVSAEVPARIAM
ncbi:hypothetical protein WME90_40580 [Sorangium sp. So ce375]|uniref:hypothetical protein n=1 Tax=Sorangium sp. So ce375 TaxID=3133306 RepID=UPI003F5B4ADE